jgi:hypothetical protein
MFQRISNSWQLVKASWSVLRADKELIVFPLVSLIGTIIVTLTFLVPMFLAGIFDGLTSGRSGVQVTSIIIGLLFYVVQYTVIFFANTALVGAAMIRLNGGDPTVRDGFRIASQHLGPILGYALISATVGMILRWIRERGILGQIAAGLFGLAWNIATYLVVPVLVIEGVGPIDAIKRSTQLLKKTWGEQIVGNLGIGAVFGLIFFVVFVLFFGGIALAISSQSTSLLVALIVLFVFALIVLGLISSALNGIYTAAVYRFATQGDGGNYFDPSLVQNAFRPK